MFRAFATHGLKRRSSTSPQTCCGHTLPIDERRASTHGITDNYTVESFKADVEFRRMAAEEAGLGFHIPVETGIASCTKSTQKCRG